MFRGVPLDPLSSWGNWGQDWGQLPRCPQHLVIDLAGVLGVLHMERDLVEVPLDALPHEVGVATLDDAIPPHGCLPSRHQRSREIHSLGPLLDAGPEKVVPDLLGQGAHRLSLPQEPGPHVREDEAGLLPPARRERHPLPDPFVDALRGGVQAQVLPELGD